MYTFIFCNKFLVYGGFNFIMTHAGIKVYVEDCTPLGSGDGPLLSCTYFVSRGWANSFHWKHALLVKGFPRSMLKKKIKV